MPVRLGDVARVQVGPEMRRGIAELDGEGEVAGGIIVMRSGKNALADHRRGQGEARRAASRACRRAWRSCRSTTARTLIKRAVDNLREKLVEEFVVVALVCVVVPVPPALGARRDRRRCRSAC